MRVLEGGWAHPYIEHYHKRNGMMKMWRIQKWHIENIWSILMTENTKVELSTRCLFKWMLAVYEGV